MSILAVLVSERVNHPLSSFPQKLKEDVRTLDPKVNEFLESSDSLLDDSLLDLPDNDLRMIERETDSLRKRWNKIKSDANTREPRFAYVVT